MFVFSCVSAFSQTNPPTAEEYEALKKENAELRAKCQALEAKLAQQQPTIRSSDNKAAADVQQTTEIDVGRADATKGGKALPRLDLDDFLSQIEGSAARYKKAATTILKSDAMKELLEKADELVRDKTISATAKVKDVRVKDMDVAEMSIVSVAGFEYAQKSGSLVSPIRTSSTGTIILRMSADDARKILPGTQVLLNGTPLFVRHGTFATQPGTLLVLNFGIKDVTGSSGGSIVLKKYDCKIGASTYSSAR